MNTDLQHTYNGQDSDSDDKPDGLEGTLNWCKQGIQEDHGH